MKISDYIVSTLVSKEIKIVFGYIGGMITHLVDSLGTNLNIRFVQTYHEQSAAIAAEGYALESGRFGVAIATSGPGATNLLTGIADAYFGSLPVLFITGQVNTYEYKYDKPIRQQGFQETEVVKIVAPLTKYAKLVDDPQRIRYELEKAIYLATSGRKGPVLLDIPMNIQRAEVDIDALEGFVPESDTKKKDATDISEIITLLEKAERPMVLLGGGCLSSEAYKEISIFLRKSKIPVVTSLMGRGTTDETYENYLGMVGSYGNRCANMGISKVDLLLALGTRLDTRQTGAEIDSFLPGGKIIHVDIDSNELEYHRLNNRIKIHQKVETFLENLNEAEIKFRDYDRWNAFLQNLKMKYNQDKEIERFVENKSPYLFMQELNTQIKEGDILCVDIGQNQMWAAQSLKLKKGQKFVTSGGLAPMGFSLPSAVGCAFASPGKTVYSINGDGGFHIALQSLMLISQYDLPVKVIVLNNKALGMITQFQHLYMDSRMEGTSERGGYLVPEIESLAKAYGLKYFKLTEETLRDSAVWEAFESSRNGILEYEIEGLTTVSPKLEYNRPIACPSPLLPEDELKQSLDF